MRIDFSKAEAAYNDIRRLVASLKENRLELTQCRIHLISDPDAYMEIDRAVKKVDSHILQAEKIAHALKKIADLYKEAETEIISSIEADELDKPGFIPIMQIVDQTGFEWSIK